MVHIVALFLALAGIASVVLPFVLLVFLVPGLLALLCDIIELQLLPELRTDKIHHILILLQYLNNPLAHLTKPVHQLSIPIPQISPSLLIIHIIEQLVDLVNLLVDVLESLHENLELDIHRDELPLPVQHCGRRGDCL